MSHEAPQAAGAGRRLPAVDCLRGAALVAMFGYHLTWDLAHFGYVDAATPFSPAMRLASHAIASTFLFVAGASLVLARRDPFDWRAYWKRMALVAGAALAVTVASWFLFPDAVILFGILHCIAAASLIALPFLFLPWPAALAAAAIVAVAPWLYSSPAFDTPWAYWTGLGAGLPKTNDFRPLLPWAAPLLAGVAAASFAIPRGAVEALARLEGRSAPARLLAFGGRHSLIVYLAHQPVFFALLSGAVLLFPPGGPADERPFRASCERQCAGSGGPKSLCVEACACTATRLKTLGLWSRNGDNRLDAAESRLVAAAASECVARARGGQSD